MHFAARYTSYEIAPLVGGPSAGFSLRLTLEMVFIHDVTGRVTPAILGPLIAGAFTRHAGGRRLFGTTPVYIEWLVHWSTRYHRIDGGHVLGVAIQSDEIVDMLVEPGHPAAAMTLLGVGRSGEWGLILFRESSFPAPPTTAAARRQQAAERERRHGTIGHEGGHAMGLTDQRTDPASTMFYRQLTDSEYRTIDQRWSEAELRTALRNVFSGPDRTPPAWL